jgi:hypothetical protein
VGRRAPPPFLGFDSLPWVARLAAPGGLDRTTGSPVLCVHASDLLPGAAVASPIPICSLLDAFRRAAGTSFPPSEETPSLSCQPVPTSQLDMAAIPV